MKLVKNSSVLSRSSNANDSGLFSFKKPVILITTGLIVFRMKDGKLLRLSVKSEIDHVMFVLTQWRMMLTENRKRRIAIWIWLKSQNGFNFFIIFHNKTTRKYKIWNKILIGLKIIPLFYYILWFGIKKRYYKYRYELAYRLFDKQSFLSSNAYKEIIHLKKMLFLHL